MIISGGSTEPPFDDVPVDLSADHKDLVMEYSGKAAMLVQYFPLFLGMVMYDNETKTKENKV